MKLHIKKGDNVKIISGDDKNKIGTVLKVYPKTQTAIVEGINIVKKHKKKNNEEAKGSIIAEEAPIKICKLMIYDNKTEKASRIGRKLNEKNKLQRYFKKTGEFI